jgi:hypothetical protein
MECYAIQAQSFAHPNSYKQDGPDKDEALVTPSTQSFPLRGNTKICKTTENLCIYPQISCRLNKIVVTVIIIQKRIGP